jgi:hypothetical protein
MRSRFYFTKDEPDRNNEEDLLLPGQLIHHASNGPRVWQVYSRRGRKGING